jgi:hypothetical protein
MLPQRGNGFGERLLNTAHDLLLCGFSAVCLIDSDSPTVPTGEFRRATEELLKPGDRAVLGPAADGGYYLIGLKHPHVRLFEQISWSTSAVMSQTVARAAEINLPVTLLETWYDVDEGESLERLRGELLDPASHWPRGYPAPRTRAYLADSMERASKDASQRSFV